MMSIEHPLSDPRLVTRSLAALHGVTAVFTVVWLALPHVASAAENGIAACAALAGLAGGALLTPQAQRRPRLALHLGVAAATVLTTLLLCFAAAPGTGFALLYVWATPFAFAYLPLHQALGHTAGVGAGFALVNLAATSIAEPLGAGVGRWFLVVTAVLVVGLIVRRITDAAIGADARFRRGFETSLNGMAIIEPTGKVIHANNALVELLARPREQLLGSTVIGFAHPHDQAHCVRIIESTLAGEDGARFSKRFVRPDGSIVWARVATALVRDGDGTPRYFFTQFQDVTGEEEARQRLDARVREQEAVAALSAEALETTDVDKLARTAAELVGRTLGAEAAPLALAETLPDSALDAYTADDLRFLKSVRQVVSTASSRIEAGTMTGVEALVRWQHPERGLLAPGEFISVAEDSGLIVPAGRWVLEEAVRQVATWQRTVPAAARLQLSVNLSTRQLADPSLVEDIAAAIARHDLRPGTLGLEITESVLMEGADAPDVLLALRQLGVKVLLDDFGTGYSSLSYLKRLSLDVLKIDRSFVDGLGSDPEDTAIVSAIVSLARTLGLGLVAEGVETECQLAELRRLGCEIAQGFLLSPPLPADAVERRLRPGPKQLPARAV